MHQNHLSYHLWEEKGDHHLIYHQTATEVIILEENLYAMAKREIGDYQVKSDMVKPGSIIPGEG